VTRRLAVAVSLASTVASMLLPFEQADAHGGKLERGLAPAGPYVVSVWTQPDPARVGTLDISAAILRADTREAVPDAEIRVTARDSTSPQSVEERGRPPSGGLFDLLAPPLYHAKLAIPTSGRWHLIVSLEGPAGRGDVGFDMDIAPPLTIPWGLIAVSGSVSFLVTVAWFAVRGRTRRRRADAAARHDTRLSASAKRDSGSVAANGRTP